MKRILFLFICVLSASGLHAQKTLAQLQTEAISIRDAGVGQNTAVKVGSSLLDFVNSYVPIIDYAVATGTNAYSATVNSIVTQYVHGQVFRIEFQNANTASSTLNINGLGNILLTSDGNNVLTAGMISAGQEFFVYYNGTSFQLNGVDVPTSFNSRTGAIIPLVGDYSSFYLPIAGTTVDGNFTLGAGISSNIILIGGNGAGNVTIKGGVGGGSAELIDENNTAGFNAVSNEAFMFNSTMSLDMASGMVFTDANSKGIQYAATGYVTQTHSLVDKEYSDTHFKGLTYTNSPSTGDATVFNGTNWTFQSPWWSFASGGTLTGPNTITGTTSNTLKFSFASLNTTQTDGAGIWLQNPTAATSGNQQISPSITWEGQGYASTPAAPQTVKFIADVLPVQGSANPNGTWRLRSSINGGAYTDQVTINNNTGILGVNAGINGINSTLTFQVGGSEKSRLTAAGDLSIGSSNDQAKLYIVQSAASGTVLPVFRSDPGAHTGMTASTEFISRDFQGSTQQWATGSLTTQRWNYFRGYTLGFVGASTATDVYNSFFEATTAGVNATITRNWGIGTNGNLQVQGNAFIGAATITPTAFLHLAASTTSNASLRIASGLAPTSPNQGEFWNDGTNLFFRTSSQNNSVATNFIASAPATTGTMTTTLTNLSAMTITPTGACTFNANGGINGQDCTFIITTSGSSSFTLTWGTNFKTTSTLATGTSTGKVFTVSFRYDGTNWNETSRTTAM